jgi:hypothetical protein
VLGKQSVMSTEFYTGVVSCADFDE